MIAANGHYHTPDLWVVSGDELEISWLGEDGRVTGTFTASFASGGAVYSLAELGVQWQ